MLTLPQPFRTRLPLAALLAALALAPACVKKTKPEPTASVDTLAPPTGPRIAYDTVPRSSYSLGPHENLFAVVKPGVIKDTADMVRLVRQIMWERRHKFTSLLVFDAPSVGLMDEDYMLKKDEISRRIAVDIKNGKLTQQQGLVRFNRESSVLTETHLRPLAEHTICYYLMGTYTMYPGRKLYEETKKNPSY